VGLARREALRILEVSPWSHARRRPGEIPLPRLPRTALRWAAMRIEIPEQKKLVYEMAIPVRWGDMDAMGHLNNGTYFRYMETARIDWMRSIGFQPDPKGEGMVIVNAFCNFYRQIEYPGDVLLRMYVSDPARTTFESWATMARAEAPEVICAAGGATTIWVDFPAQKAKPLPGWLRTLVGG